MAGQQSQRQAETVGGTRPAVSDQRVQRTGLPVERLSIFDSSKVVHGITTRTPSLPLYGNMSYMVGDDVEQVRLNRKAWAEAIGFDWSRLVLARQVHETTVVAVNERHAGCGADSVETSIRRVDGLITRTPELPIGIMAADCVPILIFDPVTRSIGAIHAGWRGTVAGIAAVAVEQMKTQFGSDPANLVVGLGPSICSDCYEVGDEVVERWNESAFANEIDAVRRFDASVHFDLRAANLGQLLLSGLHEANVETSQVCTRCSNGLIFSRRGLGPRTGLFTSVIMLRESDQGSAGDISEHRK